jgi:2,3-bisphosphoglycerate-dependent phosphoglycerate mutase
MRKLVLIKHAMPILSAHVPSNQWALSDEGKEKAKVLSNYVKEYETSRLFSSTEPKAIETAQIVGNQLNREVIVRDNLHEHLRSTKRKIYPTDEFHHIIRKFFKYPDVLIFGEETANIAKRRFLNAVDNVIKEAPSDEDVVIITHGTVMTLFISHYNEVNEFDVWRSFGLPSIVELSLDDFSLIRFINEIN